MNENIIFAEELIPLIRERLAAGQTIRGLPFRGVSMLPMLRQGKDSVDISPIQGRLQKYDLPVYVRPSGQHVMHRVVAVTDSHYICLGDNTTQLEYITPEQMIAVVSSFTRDGKRISVDAPLYRLYCRIWKYTYPFRKCWRSMKRLLRRCLK